MQAQPCVHRVSIIYGEADKHHGHLGFAPLIRNRLQPSSRTGLVRETQVMRQEEPGPGGPLGPIELRKFVPFEPCAASDGLGWIGLEAARYCEAPASAINLSPLTHHALVLIT